MLHGGEIHRTTVWHSWIGRRFLWGARLCHGEARFERPEYVGGCRRAAAGDDEQSMRAAVVPADAVMVMVERAAYGEPSGGERLARPATHRWSLRVYVMLSIPQLQSGRRQARRG